MFKKTTKRTAIRKTERDVDGDSQQHESLGDEPEINPADVLYLAKVRKKQRITAVPESTEGDGKQYLETIQEGGLSNRDKSSLVEALKHHPTAALFSSSTAAAAAKKRMEDFVESEMKKTRGDSLQEVLERPLPAVAESHSEMLVKFAEKQAREKPSSKSEAAFLADTTLILEKLPEDLKSTTRREQEGNLQSSAAMLTTIRKFRAL